MLPPRTGPHRLALDLSGFWRLRPDPADRGVAAGWAAGFDDGHAFAVPGSWNEQLAEAGDPSLPEGFRHYVGACWIARDVFVPEAMTGRRVFLRVGSADYAVRVWVDGREAGASTAAFLPLDVELTDLVRPGAPCRVVLRVDNRATADTIPQGITAAEYAEPGERGAAAEHFPPARYDFYPYGGVHRPVTLYALPQTFLRDLAVEATPDGRVRVRAEVDGPTEGTTLRVAVDDLEARAPVGDDTASLELRLAAPRPWSPADPHLYPLTASLVRDGMELDRATLRIGLREVRVDGSRLLLNGEPVFLRGFGKHEDFPVLGKAHTPALVVKDLALLRWIGANSFRTSHYPYAEDWLDAADEAGLLVIAEVPAVSLHHGKATAATQAAHRTALETLIRRDRNHPCVIAWALGNEPGLAGEPQACDATAEAYWRPLFEAARALDPTRPLTVPTHDRGPGRVLYPLCDVVAINRYYGWYTAPGQLERAAALLREELDEIAAEHGKPILVSEFGADTLPGAHATGLQLFTEEYQAELLAAYLDVIEAHPAACGAHVWNFADFRTPQHFRRVVDNLKGVFTRVRDPKRAAFALRARWTGHRGPGMTGPGT